MTRKNLVGLALFASFLSLALFLGYLYERTGNLWVPILIHTLFNSISTPSITNNYVRGVRSSAGTRPGSGSCWPTTP